MVRWFAPTSFAAAPVGTVDGGVLETLVRLAAANSTYDAVLLIRPDLVLKPLFTRTFLAADLGRLVFPFEVGPEMMPGCPGDLCPRVSDMLVWLPRSAFEHVRRSPESFVNNHHAYQYIEREMAGGLDNLRWLLPYEIIDSDPQKMSNRIYRLAGRPKAPARESWRRGYTPQIEVFPNSTVDRILARTAW